MTCICVLTAFRPSFPHLETLKKNIGKLNSLTVRKKKKKKKKKSPTDRPNFSILVGWGQHNNFFFWPYYDFCPHFYESTLLHKICNAWQGCCTCLPYVLTMFPYLHGYMRSDGGLCTEPPHARKLWTIVQLKSVRNHESSQQSEQTVSLSSSPVPFIIIQVFKNEVHVVIL